MQEEIKPKFTQGFQASPKASFVMGALVGISVMSIIGFILAFTLQGSFGESSTSGSTNKGSAAVANTNTTPTPSPSAAAPTEQAGQFKAVGKDDHVRGDANAAITMIEYSDFECPFCKRFHPTMQQVMQDYDGKVKWVYRHFPLSFHANAQKEAEASECANEQGGNDAFWEYTDKIFERTTSNGTGFALTDLSPLAKEIGLNDQKFQECLDSGKYTQHVQDDMADGTTAGITGTPGTILVDADGNSQIISGALPYEQIKQIVDSVL